MVHIRRLDTETATDMPSALLLPGANYTAQAPLLYWSAAVLLASGWRVSAAEWEESDREFGNPQEVIDRAFQLSEDQTSAEVHLVVAKSLGTLALPRCIDERIAGVWLTPLLNRSEVAAA